MLRRGRRFRCRQPGGFRDGSERRRRYFGLLAELEKAPDHVTEYLDSLPESAISGLETSEEALALKDKYMEAKVVGTASETDALHVAKATVEGATMIVSWNFKHIVHFDKIQGFNAVNIREGYSMIAIYSPKGVV